MRPTSNRALLCNSGSFDLDSQSIFPRRNRRPGEIASRYYVLCRLLLVLIVYVYIFIYTYISVHTIKHQIEVLLGSELELEVGCRFRAEDLSMLLYSLKRLYPNIIPAIITHYYPLS